MRCDSCHVFEELTPPEGGLEGLQRKLDADGERIAARWAIPPAVAALSLLLWIFWPRAVVPELAAFDAHPSQVALGLCAAPSEPVTVVGEHRKEVAVRRVPTSSSDVVIYWVETL